MLQPAGDMRAGVQGTANASALPGVQLASAARLARYCMPSASPHGAAALPAHPLCILIPQSCTLQPSQPALAGVLSLVAPSRTAPVGSATGFCAHCFLHPLEHAAALRAVERPWRAQPSSLGACLGSPSAAGSCDGECSGLPSLRALHRLQPGRRSAAAPAARAGRRIQPPLRPLRPSQRDLLCGCCALVIHSLHFASMVSSVPARELAPLLALQLLAVLTVAGLGS